MKKSTTNAIRKLSYFWFFAFALIHLGIFLNNFIFDTLLSYKYPAMFLVIYALLYILPAYLAGYGLYKNRPWGWGLGLLVALFHIWFDLSMDISGAPFLSYVFYIASIVFNGLFVLFLVISKLKNLKIITSSLTPKQIPTLNLIVIIWYLANFLIYSLELLIGKANIESTLTTVGYPNQSLAFLAIVSLPSLIIYVVIAIWIYQNKKSGWIAALAFSLFSLFILFTKTGSILYANITYLNTIRLLFSLAGNIVVIYLSSKTLFFSKKE